MTVPRIPVRGGLVVLAAAALLGCRTVLPLLAPPPSSTPSASPSPSASATPAGATAVPAGEPVDLETIQEQVSTVRGLYPSRPLHLEVLAPPALRQHVETDFLAGYTPEQAADDVRVLSLFGLLDPDFDLLGFYRDFYNEQVAGYYDSLADTMYVVGTTWGGAERLTYAHEYVHALQDQAYDLEGGLGYSDEACLTDSERCQALLALLEGDASLAEEQWWQAYATEQDSNDLRQAVESYRGQVFDSAPAYLQQDFLFPYVQGLDFVRALFRRGGWAAVDAAYHSPPTTTEVILHPELYGKAVPLPVDLARAAPPAGGWNLLQAGVLGEWTTYLVLDQQVPEGQAARAAAGWGGDAYRAYHDGNRTALVLLTRWDTARDAFEFVDAFQAYAAARFGQRTTQAAERRWTWDDGSVLLERAYDQTLWVLAPDEATQRAIRQSVEFPVPR